MRFFLIPQVIFALLCGLPAAKATAQCSTPSRQTIIIATDAGTGRDTVFFGHHPSASIGLDTSLCERELPPVPPAGAFDFRFLNPPGREGLNTPAGLGQGVYRDYRPQVSFTQVDTHRIRFQPGTGGMPITLSWSLPELALLCDSAVLVDEFGGGILRVRMHVVAGAVIANPAVTTLLLVKYGTVEIPAAPVLVSPANGAPAVPPPVNLTWQPAPGASRYHVQLSTDSLFGAITLDDSVVVTTSRGVAGLTPAVRFFWRARGASAAGWGPWSPARSFTTATSATFTYAAPAGWSVLSLPVAPADGRRSTIFPGASSYATAFSGGGYVRRDTLAPGEGFWLKFPAPQTPFVTGAVLAADTVVLAAGWNMTGSITSAVAASSVVTQPPGLLITPFYAYSGSYAPADTLKPGAGYWVKASAAGLMMLTAAPAGVPPRRGAPVR